jgi:hypothetical protein
MPSGFLGSNEVLFVDNAIGLPGGLFKAISQASLVSLKVF